MENTSYIVDWIHLPTNAECNELWNCLHDSEIHEIKSDLLSRTLILLINNEFIAEHHNLPSGKFQFSFQNVQSVRVVSFSIWPGKFELPKNTNREQEYKLIEEYQSKWREESLDWDKFEKTISVKVPLLIASAFLASGENHIGFRIQGHANDKYHEIFMRADSLLISDNNQKHYDIKKFEMLGQLYWDDLAKNNE